MIETVSNDPLFEFELEQVDVARWLDIGQPVTVPFVVSGGSVGRELDDRNRSCVMYCDHVETRRLGELSELGQAAFSPREVCEQTQIHCCVHRHTVGADLLDDKDP